MDRAGKDKLLTGYRNVRNHTHEASSKQPSRVVTKPQEVQGNLLAKVIFDVICGLVPRGCTEP